MKKILLSIAVLCLSVRIFAVESATLIVATKDGKTETRQMRAERINDSTARIVVPKTAIPENFLWFEVQADNAVARKGEEGFWIYGRGQMGTFRLDNGELMNKVPMLPIYGMKNPRGTFLAVIKTMRWDAQICVSAENGVYKIRPRWNFAHMGYMPNDDIEIDFIKLKDSDADYSGMGRAYRKIKLESGLYKPLKDRIKDNAKIRGIATAMIMRTNSHSIIRGFRGGKVSDKMDLTPEFARSKIEANQPFAETKNFIDVIKRAGMTDVHICDVGWESGGTDARYPQIFPIDECSGGEAGLKDYLKYAADNGYLVGAHTNHTDAYTNSDMWDSDFVCRKSDGKLLRIGVFNGGNMYYICQKCSWDKFIKKQLEQTRALGYEGVLYIDIYSARPPDPCFNPKHPATRDVQAEYQNKALSYARSLFGGVASECGFEHCLHNLDYVNYLGRDMLHGEGFGEHNKDKNSFLPDKSHYHEMVDRIAPLWEIVFHGIVPSNPDKFTQFYRPKGSTNLLRLAEFGGRPVFYSSSYKPAAVEKYKAMYDFFQPMKHLQLEFMEENKPLSDGVYLTRYGDGSRVVTNYTANDFIYDGKTVKARDYLLIAPR